MKREPDAILILLDAEEDCPAQLAPRLLARARAAVPSEVAISVVVVCRSFEAWLIAGFHSKAFRDKVRTVYPETRLDSPKLSNVENITGKRAKSMIADWLGIQRYEPPIYQHRLAIHLPFGQVMTRRSPSFAKLLRELEAITAGARRRPGRDRPRIRPLAIRRP